METRAVVLGKYLAPAVIGADPFCIRDVWARMDGVVNGQLPAKGAIDIALHDLIGKALGIPVWRLLGGISKCMDITAICDAAGLSVPPGCSTASGIGLAAAHHFAAAIEPARGCHASPLARAVDDIIRDPLPAYPARVTLTDAPRLGVEVDWDKVAQYAA
jgi:L-alanine-DL-glutamate epimerase-like enolase superfamily enzyme